ERAALQQELDARSAALAAQLAQVTTERDAHHQACKVAAHDRDVARAEIERLRAEHETALVDLRDAAARVEARRQDAEAAQVQATVRIDELTGRLASADERSAAVQA